MAIPKPKTGTVLWFGPCRQLGLSEWFGSAQMSHQSVMSAEVIVDLVCLVCALCWYEKEIRVLKAVRLVSPS